MKHERQPFPHWHDFEEWAKHTTLTRCKFLAMDAETFADWVYANWEDFRAFCYAYRYPEGVNYARQSREWVTKSLYQGFLNHPKNWPTVNA